MVFAVHCRQNISTRRYERDAACWLASGHSQSKVINNTVASLILRCSLQSYRFFFLFDTKRKILADFTAMCSPGFFKHDSPAMIGASWFSHNLKAIKGFSRFSAFYDCLYLGGHISCAIFQNYLMTMGESRQTRQGIIIRLSCFAHGRERKRKIWNFEIWRNYLRYKQL